MKRILLGTALLMCTASADALAVASSLTLFHNNDGESKLLGSAGFGGIDYFLGAINQARSSATLAGRDVLTLSSGDNFLAGLAFDASRNRVGGFAAGSIDPKTQNYYDALALVAVGYDAITIGNHEFDFGPNTLADFIAGYTAAGGTAPFLSANLDFAAEASLQALVAGGQIAKSTVVSGGVSGVQYGIIGVTTPTIDSVSSPGGVVPIGLTLADVAAAVNAEVAILEGMGVDRVILSGHLQGLNQDQALVPLLSGVDVIIAGGGDELLSNAPDANTSAPFGPSIDGPYPTISTATDLDGKTIALVTTQGEYRYVGQLEVEFDAMGTVTGVNGNPILVNPLVSPQELGVVNGIDIANDIVSPLAADIMSLQATVVGSTLVNLDGRRASVRTMETNLGSLIADAFVFQALQIGGLSGDPVIAVTNGGGIRNDRVIVPGNLTVADITDILPFANSVVVLNGLSVGALVQALENSVKNFPGQNGGFLQIGGFTFSFSEDTGEVLRIALADGSLLYTQALGDVFGGTLDLVTNSFTAAGGDGFDEFEMLPAFDLGVSYADALRLFIQNGLGGSVQPAAYPVGGLGRIGGVKTVSEPAAAAIAGAGLLTIALLARRRRR